MGDVYAWRNVALDQVRAVKVMRPGTLSPAGEARFLREMKILARLSHENVVPVHDANVHEGVPYFVMPLLPGGSLSDHLERFRGNVRACVALMERVARGVHHVHEQG